MKFKNLLFALLFLSVSFPAFAAESQKPGIYYFCIGLEKESLKAFTKGRAFYSGIFETKNTDLGPVQDAFGRFLQKKYAYTQNPAAFTTSILCTGGHNRKNAEATLRNRIQKRKNQNRKGTIKTGWTFEP